MEQVLIGGAGHIGIVVALLLAESGRYKVTIIDQKPNTTSQAEAILSKPHITFLQEDCLSEEVISNLVNKKGIRIFISCLPYFCNTKVADIAKSLGLHYFDLTEDVKTTAYIREVAKGATTIFAPQCGLAPGFVNIVANDIAQKLEKIDSLSIYTGAIPRNVKHPLKYALTWSVDGVINEYINSCKMIRNGEKTQVEALTEVETLHLDGRRYEAFTTSGGIGNLIEAYDGKVKELFYKTLRYPGHCKKMRFLLKDLKLEKKRDVLRSILVEALPKSDDDVVLVYESASGLSEGDFVEKSFFRKYVNKEIHGIACTAIQYTTAAGVCAMLDLAINKHWSGFITAERYSLDEFLKNTFGQHFQKKDVNA